MNVADICPVGALTTKDFRFKIRVWFLEDVEGVCTGCSNGCNIHMGTANNKVYRYVPRRNDEVNDTWICDAGRMSYKAIEANRIAQSLVRTSGGQAEARSYAAAVEEASARLRALIDAKGAGVVAGIASAHATNEDLFAFRRFFEALGTETAGLAVVKGRSDNLLITEEKAANAAGARALGFGDAASVVERIRAGGIDALVVLGHDLLDGGYLDAASDLEALDTLILIDTHHSPLERIAHVVLPARHTAEKHGTLTNHAGRVQRVCPAVESPFEAHSEGDTISRIAVGLGLAGFAPGSAPGSAPEWNPRSVSKQLAEAVPAFDGNDLDSLGDLGRPLSVGGGAS
jgi:NADH-quinone oxidoreductase subunit G